MKEFEVVISDFRGVTCRHGDSLYAQKASWLLAVMTAIKKALDDVLLYVCSVSPVMYKELVCRLGPVDYKLNSISELFLSSFKYSENPGFARTTTHEFRSELLACLSDLSSSLPLLQGVVDPCRQAALPAELVRNCQVIFSTLASAGHSLLKKEDASVADVLVVDEAAQALEAELAVPICYGAPRHIVLVGDPNQLPATLLSVEAQKAQRGVSTMQRLLQQCGHKYYLLDTQYRMHPEIAAYPNSTFYQNQLFNSEHVVLRKTLFPSQPWATGWMEPYAFINVLGTEMVLSKHNPSLQNIPEARAVCQVALFLSTAAAQESRNITILTFYSAQVHCIQQQLASRSSSHGSIRHIRVMTVDSFQGSESDIVLISFVRSNAGHRIGFLKDFQRLNVALTRAKYSLIICGSAATLENCGLPILSDLVEDVRKRNLFYDYSSDIAKLVGP